MDESFPQRETQPVPITEHQVSDAHEIEADIRHRLEIYRGEELVKELVDYVALSLMEQIMTKDSEPKRLERLSEDKLETIKRLAAGIIPHP